MCVWGGGGGLVDKSYQEIKYIRWIEMNFKREFLVLRDHNKIANILPEPNVNTYKRIYLASHFLGFFSQTKTFFLLCDFIPK